MDQRRDDSSDSLSDSEPPLSADQTAVADEIQSDADATPPPPAIASLHRHALKSIFAFLGLRELALALRVSRDWLAAVGSMRRLGVALRIRGPQSWALSAVAHSAMGRHIGELSSVHLVGEQFFPVVDQLAHLRALRCTLCLPLADWPVRFPAQLRLLDVHLLGYVGPANLNAAIAAIAQLSRIEELGVTLPRMDPQLSFGPLTALPLLRRLGVLWRPMDGELTAAQVDELRAMTHLEKVSVSTTALLRRLLRQPHDLQWRQISVPGSLDDEAAALLPQLPSLTAVAELLECARFEWLRGLPNLADVRLAFGPEGASGPADSLVAALRHCANTQILSLGNFSDLTPAHLADLLPRLPRLRELTLHNIPIDSLAFLAQPPLTNQLSRFELWGCDRLSLAELRHVYGLRGLTHLTLYESFLAPLHEESRSELTPPSALLPRLVEFEYKAR